MKEVKMKEIKQNEKTNLSTSQMKRLTRKKEIEKAKRNSRLIKILSYCVIAVISIGLVSIIGYKVYWNITKIKPSSDYSAYLTENGLIENVTATKSVDLVDYNNITVPLTDVEYTEESLDADIQKLLEEYTKLETDTDTLIVEGDKVNIDYVGTIDGVAFEGGTSEGDDLEIGSDSFIDGFEDQLIGSGVGDKVTVEVTFPNDYQDEAVAGQDAVFEVVINGIYGSPEFNDELVQENLSEFASTADEYKEYLRKTNYDDKLSTWLETYLMDNTSVLSYPKEYTNHLKSTKKYYDQSTYQYMNELYASMGSEGPSSFEEYIGMSEEKYDAGLVDDSQTQAKKALISQAIYENEGLAVTEDEYSKYSGDNTAEDFESAVEQYGKGYVMQGMIYEKVLEYVKEKITVE